MWNKRYIRLTSKHPMQLDVLIQQKKITVASVDLQIRIAGIHEKVHTALLIR